MSEEIELLQAKIDEINVELSNATDYKERKRLYSKRAYLTFRNDLKNNLYDPKTIIRYISSVFEYECSASQVRINPYAKWSHKKQIVKIRVGVNYDYKYKRSSVQSCEFDTGYTLKYNTIEELDVALRVPITETLILSVRS